MPSLRRYLQSPAGREVRQWLPVNLAVPVLSQNKSRGLLPDRWLLLTVSRLGAVLPPGSVTTRIPPENGLRLCPFELPVTVLRPTCVSAAPTSAMPIPDSGGSPSAGSPAHALLFVRTMLSPTLQLVAGPGESASTRIPAQLPVNTLSLTIPKSALRASSPSPALFTDRLSIPDARACGEPPMYSP